MISVQDLHDLAAAVAGPLGYLFTGVVTLGVWRYQLLARRRYEVAERILQTAMDAGDALRVALVGWSRPGTISSRPRMRDETADTEEMTRRRDQIYAPAQSLLEQQDKFNELTQCMILAKVHFGEEPRRSLASLRLIKVEIETLVDQQLNADWLMSDAIAKLAFHEQAVADSRREMEKLKISKPDEDGRQDRDEAIADHERRIRTGENYRTEYQSRLTKFRQELEDTRRRLRAPREESEFHKAIDVNLEKIESFCSAFLTPTWFALFLPFSRRSAIGGIRPIEVAASIDHKADGRPPMIMPP